MSRNNSPFNPNYFRNQLDNLLVKKPLPKKEEVTSQLSYQSFQVTQNLNLETVFENEFLAINRNKHKRIRVPVRTADSLNLLNSLKGKITGQEFASHAADYSLINVQVKSKSRRSEEVIDSAPIRKLNQKQLNFTSSYYQDDFIKAQPKIRSSDFNKKLKSKRGNRPGRKIFNLQKATGFSIFTLLIFSVAYLWGSFFLNKEPFSQGQIAGANESLYSNYPKLEEYKVWIQKETGKYYNPEEDLDNEGLKNYEEFILNTNPKDPYSCDEEKKLTDSQNLIQLIDPATCKPMDLENKSDLEKFNQVINIPEIKKAFFDDPKNTLDSKTPETKIGLLKIFGAASYSELDKITPEEIQQQLDEKKAKIDYLNTIKKIDDYIKKFRSYDVSDRNYAPPVGPSVYLDVSLRYKVPLKYTLAIARNESRFGTDSYNSEGALSRIGKYKNIFSIGLTDSSSSGYENWEDGVEAWGKWYQKFESRGVSDCVKWKIFNPNGDYCSKIESMANQIDFYLKS